MIVGAALTILSHIFQAFHVSHTLNVRISRVDGATADLPLPAYATSGSAGMDVCAAVDQDLAPTRRPDEDRVALADVEEVHVKQPVRTLEGGQPEK